MRHQILDKIWQRLNRISQNARLPVALAIAIVISLLLAFVSVALYSLGGSSKLDLSRPGYERERNQLVRGDQQKTFDTTSPINKGAIDTFLKSYDKNTKDLNSFGDFKDQALEDSDLQLSGQSPNQGL
ncbi:MAG TPA: hypothetical protein VNX65_00270 [Patescibacteria group bacterium]|jgi:hypothetical protein|nr:hypothetical protein [Patescibacteria group bacterium]